MTRTSDDIQKEIDDLNQKLYALQSEWRKARDQEIRESLTQETFRESVMAFLDIQLAIQRNGRLMALRELLRTQTKTQIESFDDIKLMVAQKVFNSSNTNRMNIAWYFTIQDLKESYNHAVSKGK